MNKKNKIKETITEKLLDKEKRVSFVDTLKESETRGRNKKVTLSLPEDVVKLLWLLKAEGKFKTASHAVSFAVRELAKKYGIQFTKNKEEEV